jgi:hypothetical protein
MPHIFIGRTSCDLRIPGLYRMFATASGQIPLTEPAVQWEEQLCARKGQIYFIDDPKVQSLRDQVEAEWTIKLISESCLLSMSHVSHL